MAVGLSWFHGHSFIFVGKKLPPLPSPAGPSLNLVVDLDLGRRIWKGCRCENKAQNLMRALWVRHTAAGARWGGSWSHLDGGMRDSVLNKQHCTSGGWEVGKWRLKHYLLIINMCSLCISELRLAEGKTQPWWQLYWLFHWPPTLESPFPNSETTERVVISRVWIHLTSVFSLRDAHPLWACKTSVSLGPTAWRNL